MRILQNPVVALCFALAVAFTGCGDDDERSRPDGSDAADLADDARGDDADGLDEGDTFAQDTVADVDLADADTASQVVELTWPLVLEAGQVAEVPLVDGHAVIDVNPVGGDNLYVLVLASTLLEETTQTFDYSVANAVAAAEGPVPVRLDGCSVDDEPWATTPVPDETPPSGAGPAVGSVRAFDVPVGWRIESVDFEAVAVGESAVVWADITSGNGAELEPAFVAEFLADFEGLILPRARDVFGVESDLDGDGRIALLFTPWTYSSAVAFFSPCDLVDLAGCGYSNSAEVLYLTPPNAIPPPYNTSNAIKEILAHELQHLIHYHRALLRNGLAEGEDNAYLLEGFGALAQDLTGFQSGNLYVTKAGLDRLDEASLADLLVDGGAYVEGADAPRDGALRGAAYLFVRWLYDRAGADEALGDGRIQNTGGPALVRALFEATETIAGTLPAVEDTTLSDVIMDFATTLAASNREDADGVAPQNPCFAYAPTVSDPLTARQRGANLYAAFHGQAMQGPATQPYLSADGLLRAGGVELLEWAANAGDAAIIEVSVDPAAAARLRVVRVR